MQVLSCVVCSFATEKTIEVREIVEAAGKSCFGNRCLQIESKPSFYFRQP